MRARLGSGRRVGWEFRCASPRMTLRLARGSARGLKPGDSAPSTPRDLQSSSPHVARRYTRSRARARERGSQRRHVREQCRIMSVHGSLTRGCCSVFKAEVLRRPKVPKATEHRRCRSTSNSYIYRRVFSTPDPVSLKLRSTGGHWVRVVARAGSGGPRRGKPAALLGPRHITHALAHVYSQHDPSTRGTSITAITPPPTWPVDGMRCIRRPR